VTVGFDAVAVVSGAMAVVFGAMTAVVEPVTVLFECDCSCGAVDLRSSTAIPITLLPPDTLHTA
jgi:hypothetical protein